jgi:hypothetical protein
MKTLIVATALMGLTAIAGCSKPEAEKARTSVPDVSTQTQALPECGFIERDATSVNPSDCQVEGRKANGTVRRKGFDYIFVSDAVVKKDGDHITFSYYAPPARNRQLKRETINLKTGDRVQNVTQSGKSFTFNNKDLPKYEEYNEGYASLKIALLEIVSRVCFVATTYWQASFIEV